METLCCLPVSPKLLKNQELIFILFFSGFLSFLFLKILCIYCYRDGEGQRERNIDV